MEKLKERASFHLFLMVLLVFLSMTVGVLGSIPLFLLRASAGRKAYVVYSIVLLAVLAAVQGPLFAAPMLCCILLVGVFEEARILDCSLFQSGLASLLVVVGLVCLVLSALVQYQSLDLVAYLTTKIDVLIASIKEVQPETVIETNTILVLIPSAMVMVFMMSLWFGQVVSSFIVKRYEVVANYLNEAEKRTLQDFDGSNFQVPSVLIWPTLVMMAFAFLDMQQESLQVVASNFLNILIAVYFFQGVALIAHLFKAMEVGPFWQWFWYVLVLTQIHMILLVSSIGFADYWMNFRLKINKHFVKAGEGRLK